MVISWENFLVTTIQIMFDDFHILQKIKHERNLNIMGIIYKFTNQINNKSYIGQTINPQQRYSSHKSAINNKNHTEYYTPLHEAFRKYGFENFTYEILAKDIENIDILNILEEYYIQYFNSYGNHGYNQDLGGKNAEKPKSEITKEKLRWSHANLTKDEVIELRLAYQNQESPKKIYEQKYKNRITYQAFYNIWTGKRYSNIMPEVIQTGRHTKMTKEKVLKIRELRKENSLKWTYRTLAKQFQVSESTISDILNYRTWKNI